MTATTATRTKPAACLYMLIVSGLLLNAGPVAAGEKDMSQEYLTCINKSNGVTSEMLGCISAEYDRQDARLNENYKRLMSKLSPKRREGLLEAQRAWLKFRDANCSFYYDPEGGSAAHLAGTDCTLNATAERATELEDLMPPLE